MKWSEIANEASTGTVKPSGTTKPKKTKPATSGTVPALNLDQARKRSTKQAAASAKVADVKAKAAVDIASANRKLAEIK